MLCYIVLCSVLFINQNVQVNNKSKIIIKWNKVRYNNSDNNNVINRIK